jgi:hypothetical protein
MMHINPKTILKQKLCKSTSFKQEADIVQFFDAYYANHIEKLLMYKNIIDDLLSNHSILIYKLKSYSKRLYDVFTTYLNDNDDDIYGPSSKKQFESFKFLVMNKIIDPNKTIDGELMLYTCIRNFSGWEIEKQRIEFLLSHTSPETIYKYRNSEDCTVLLGLSQSSGSYEDTHFEYLYNTIIATGININHIGKDSDGKQITFLHGMIHSWHFKYIQLALDAGQNIMSCIEDKFRSNMHVLQWILYLHKFQKDVKYINDIVKLIVMLVEKGYDLSYQDMNARYLIDYMTDYGFATLMTEQNITIRDYLISKGSPTESGIKMTQRLFDDESNIYEAQISGSHIIKLLYDNRYEKDPIKIQNILEGLKKMEKETENLENVYELFCRSWGPWYHTIVAEYLDIIINM